MQTLIVALLVLGCSVYAAWALLPAAARRALASALLKLAPWPDAIALRMRRVATAASGCGCDGCDHAPAKAAAKSAAPAPQVVTFHPRMWR